jgi:hypothetical protein
VITQTGMSDKAARKKGSRPKDDPEIIVTGVLGATKARKATRSRCSVRRTCRNSPP